MLTATASVSAFQDAAQCAFFLPKYDLRAALDLVATLRQQLGAAQAEAAPKKRFAFGARAQAIAPRPVTQAAAAASVAALAAQQDAEPSCPGLRHAAPGSTHVIRLDALPDSGVEYAIEDCTGAHASLLPRACVSASLTSSCAQTGCTITLIGPLRALRLRRLSSCTVLVVAIAGACYVEHCKECRLHLGCHQARIHDTTYTHMYLVRAAVIADVRASCKHLTCCTCLHRGVAAGR